MATRISPTERNDLYRDLVKLRDSAKQWVVWDIKPQLFEVLSLELPTLQAAEVVQKARKQLYTRLLEIQKFEQGICIHEGDVDNPKVHASPHIDDVLRWQWLSENMTYEDRLQFIFSPIENFVKINQDYLKQQKSILKKNGKHKNKGAIEAHFREMFINHFMVFDTDRITDDMRLHLFDGKSLDELTNNVLIAEVRKKLANPYFLQYQIPGEKPQDKPQKRATSRIVFPRSSPAIIVFRSDDTHPMVDNPTKHEKRKIQKGMDMYVTNSSNDVITQQYKSIQHITQDKWFVASLLKELQNLVQDTAFGEDEKLVINQAIEAMSGQINPEVLMARLYNLSRIADFANKTVQQNLLLGAMNKLSRRHQTLWMYLYYMIPQLQALETIHAKNIENMESLHRNLLMSTKAENPSPWLFTTDKRNEMEQFNKHDPLKRLERGLRYHSIEQKDHLVGMFYSMHQQVGKLLPVQDIKERNKVAKIMVYTHRLIMAAEKLKQDIQLGKIKRPEINVRGHFQEIRYDIFSWISEDDRKIYFNTFYATMKKAENYIIQQKVHLAIKELSLFKTALEPTLQE